jgi:hypothetical protein
MPKNAGNFNFCIVISRIPPGIIEQLPQEATKRFSRSTQLPLYRKSLKMHHFTLFSFLFILG